MQTTQRYLSVLQRQMGGVAVLTKHGDIDVLDVLPNRHIVNGIYVNPGSNVLFLFSLNSTLFDVMFVL